MRFTNDPIPDCVPEYYRAQKEERDRQYDLAMQRQGHYLANKQKLDAAVLSGLPVLPFGGYGPCWECPNADHDTMTNDEDDICLVICHDPSCPEYIKHQSEGGIAMNR